MLVPLATTNIQLLSYNNELIHIITLNPKPKLGNEKKNSKTYKTPKLSLVQELFLIFFVFLLRGMQNPLTFLFMSQKTIVIDAFY